MKSDPASFCCSQNCAAASDTEIGKKEGEALGRWGGEIDLLIISLVREFISDA